MKTFILFAIIMFFHYQDSSAQTATNDKKNSSFKYNASIAGKIKGHITKDEILNAKNLILEKEAQQAFHIISFKMTIVCKGRDILEYENMNNGELNNSMIEGLKNAEENCRLLFEYIKVADSTNSINSIQWVRPLELHIK